MSPARKKIDEVPKKNSFEVRLALPEDVASLVALHSESFTPKEHLLIIFGTPVLRSVYSWFICSPETFTLVALSKGEIVGLCTACSRPYNRPMVQNNAFALAFGALRNPWVLFHPEIARRFRLAFSVLRGRNLNRRQLDLEPPAQLGFLAVHKDFHGTSLGENLIRGAVKECGRRNWKRVRAGIYKNNLPARFMYAKLGFKENKVLRTDQLIFVETDLNCP